uniref:Uncharacterized protein n=1 Tax=Sphaerodactylus townsendi TaxID=933632 RepID=A0ACB8FVU2_9SAUR
MPAEENRRTLVLLGTTCRVLFYFIRYYNFKLARMQFVSHNHSFLKSWEDSEAAFSKFQAKFTALSIPSFLLTTYQSFITEVKVLLKSTPKNYTVEAIPSKTWMLKGQTVINSKGFTSHMLVLPDA